MNDIVERLGVLAASLANPQVAVEAQREVERLRAEVAFLHQRRGEIAIERDRYKAALGKYPEGRDVFLGGALAEIERLRASECSAWGAFFSRDGEIEGLQKHVAACNIANVRLATELASAKALLREALEEIHIYSQGAISLYERIRAALGDSGKVDGDA